jgi:hypothetical protein
MLSAACLSSPHHLHSPQSACPTHAASKHPIQATPPPPAGELLIKALYGQANELPASLFDLGISPFINASIIMFMLMVLPKEALPEAQWLTKLRQARKEGKQVGAAQGGGKGRFSCCLA